MLGRHYFKSRIAPVKNPLIQAWPLPPRIIIPPQKNIIYCKSFSLQIATKINTINLDSLQLIFPNLISYKLWKGVEKFG